MMPKRQYLVTACLVSLLAGCAGNPAPKTQDGGNRQVRRSNDAHLAAVAFQKDGVDQSNFLFWKQLVPSGCDALRQGADVPKEPPLSAARLQQEFGPLELALKPFFEAADQPSAMPALSRDADWERFAAGFDLFASRLAAEPSSLRWQAFIGMLGGSLGQFPRWQLWYAQRFDRGLTTEAFLRSGEQAGRLMTEHWTETDTGKYPDGATRKIFGKAWQPKGWGAGNRQEAAALGRLLAALTEASADPESRVKRALEVLDDFRRDQTLVGTWSGPHICGSSAQQGLQEFSTAQDFADNDREPAATPHAGRQGKRQGGRFPGGSGMP